MPTPVPPDPAFEDAYGALIEYVAANCGFAELDATATEYAFGGVPEEVAAGPTIISLTNIGEQVHEIVIYRINDDVTLTVEELFALPEEEAESMLTEVGGTFAGPGRHRPHRRRPDAGSACPPVLHSRRHHP